MPKILLFFASALAILSGPCPALAQQNDNASQSLLNITAATVVKAASGRIGCVSVTVAGSAAGAIYDTTTTGSVAASNQIMSVPNAVATICLEWKLQNGIVVVPGTGQTISLSFL